MRGKEAAAKGDGSRRIRKKAMVGQGVMLYSRNA